MEIFLARPRTRSDEEILSAARACFLELGASVSTQVIAKRLGLSAPALFHRFGSKQELLIAAMCPAPSSLPLQAVDKPLDSRSVSDQLREIALEVTNHMRTIMPCIQVLRSAGISPTVAWERYEAPPPVLLHRALTRWFQRAMDSNRIRPCVPAHLALSFLGALQAPNIMMLAGKPSGTPEQIQTYLDDLIELFSRGIVSVEESP